MGGRASQERKQPVQMPWGRSVPGKAKKQLRQTVAGVRDQGVKEGDEGRGHRAQVTGAHTVGGDFGRCLKNIG